MDTNNVGEVLQGDGPFLREPVMPTEAEVVPPQVKTVARQVWISDDATRLQRTLQMAIRDPYRLGLLPLCGVCQKEGRSPECHWQKINETGQVVLVCDCTMRIMEGVRG